MAERKKSFDMGGVSKQLINQAGRYWGYVVTTGLSAAAVTLQDGNTISNVATMHATTAITAANPGVVTTALPHGFSSNDVVTLTGVAGMVEILATTRYTITVISTTSFSIGVDTTTYTAHTAGTGVVNKVNLGVVFEVIPASTPAGTTKTLASPIRLDAGASTTTTATGVITLLFD